MTYAKEPQIPVEDTAEPLDWLEEGEVPMRWQDPGKPIDESDYAPWRERPGSIQRWLRTLLGR